MDNYQLRSDYKAKYIGGVSGMPSWKEYYAGQIIRADDYILPAESKKKFIEPCIIDNYYLIPKSQVDFLPQADGSEVLYKNTSPMASEIPERDYFEVPDMGAYKKGLLLGGFIGAILGGFFGRPLIGLVGGALVGSFMANNASSEKNKITEFIPNNENYG